MDGNERYKSMKKLILVMLFLTSCGPYTNQGVPDQSGTQNDTIYVYSVHLKDGRIIQCVTTNHGALACDFDHSIPEKLEIKVQEKIKVEDDVKAK